MTEKEKFANACNFSNFARNWPKIALILAIILLPIIPIVLVTTAIIVSIYEVFKDIKWKELKYEWFRLYKAIGKLITYIRMK